MNILMLANKPPFPPVDGGTIATFNMAKGFAQNGHQVTVLCMNTLKHNTDTADIPRDVTEMMRILTVNVPAGINSFSALINLLFSRKPYNAQRFVSPDFAKALVSLLGKEDFDIVQTEGLYLTPYVPIARKHTKALFALRAHNVEHEIWERITAGEQSFFKRTYLRNLTRRIKRMETAALLNYDMLVTITKRDLTIFKRLGNTATAFVAPTGIDTSAVFPERDVTDYPSLFHIGALDWAPNREGLLWFLENCWEKLKTMHPELKFYIAGRNAPVWFEKRLTGVEYVGEVEDAHGFMRGKAVMIVPLLSGSGMRVKIVEGMTLGKTIVTTSIGAEGIDCTHNENILIADSPEEFQNEIERILNDKLLFDHIGENAMRFIRERYDNLKITGELCAFFQKAIRQHHEKACDPAE
ncbi:MAG: glycosyltransferase family 4 protein [Bacteroidetes bacterium]|nr:glycosyltransferase family 4 protein [Bacteroidota bacterium]